MRNKQMTTVMNRALNALKAGRTGTAKWPDADSPVESGVEIVGNALRNGEFGSARLRFLRLAEQSQIRVLQQIPAKDAARLAGGLPTYTVARLYERLPRDVGRAIVQALPEAKRHGIVVILRHRRRG
jgi:hypothetical protein